MTYAFTRVPNALIDTALPQLSGAEAKLLIVLIRQTLGFQRDEVTLSFSQLIRQTGIGSRATLTQAINGLTTMRLFTIDRAHGNTNQYQINHDKFEPVQKLNYPSTDTEPPKASSLYIRSETEPAGASLSATSSITELPPVQKVNRGSTKTELVPVQKLNCPERKEKEMIQEKEKENHPPGSSMRGIREAGVVDAEAMTLLKDFGLWESTAGRLVQEQGLTADIVSAAISAIREEKRDGARIQNPAALLRSRLETGWRPETHKTTYALPEETSPRLNDIPHSPSSMTATFHDASGRQWQVEDFTGWLKDQLALQLPKEAFNTWLRPASFTEAVIAEGRLASLSLTLVNEATRDWVRVRLAKVIERTASTMLGYPIEWNYTIPARDERAA